MAAEQRGVPVPGLAALRRRAVLSQEELAKLSGVGVATIRRLEQGANAHYATIDKLAKALKTTRRRLTRAPDTGEPQEEQPEEEETS